MNNKLKARLLMSPFVILVILAIIGFLHAIGTHAYAILSTGWTMRETNVLLGVMGILGGLVLIAMMFKKGLDLYDQSECICTKTCDCQDPEGKKNGSNGGVCLISNECPIHNDDPDPHPDCKVHNRE